MAVRLSLMIAALSLVVAGCNQHAKKARAPHAGKPSQVHVAKRQALRPLNLRGALDHGDRKSKVRAAAVPPAWTPKLTRSSRYPIVPAMTTASESQPYRLDSGDRLRIVVFGQENLSRSYSVDGGGFISMPLIGATRARGSTTFELERRIAGKLRTKYVKDPKVTVEIQDYRPFFILGEVRRPGQFPYVNGMTVRTAVAIAGGYTERARESKVKLTRRINGHETTIKVPDSHSVRPGDTIYVKERFF